MSTPQFTASFNGYLTDARQARDDDRHHDYRRQLFLAFLGSAFGIEQAAINVEQYIQLAGRQVLVTGTARIRKGWIDAVFNDLVFEFKRDLSVETPVGLRELRDYLTSLPDGTSCVGLLTDGLVFTAYVLDDTQPGGLRETDRINLENVAPDTAYLWLDAYFLRQRNVPPTAADIVNRFGLSSPSFVLAGRELREALQIFAAAEAGAYAVKRQQWAFHLARVYGTADVTTDELYVRHTYLCQFAKLLAYTARFGIASAIQEAEHVVDGRAFEVLGVSNIGEQDFFAWVLAPEVKAQTLAVLRRIVASFAVYNLSRIDQDLFKQLYQNLVDPATRHDLGEFYTPDWLAELTLRDIDYGNGQSLLDPACGSGTFLFTAIRLLAESGVRGQDLVDFALDNIMGVDVHPLAVTIAKLNYMLAILPHLQHGGRREQRTIPVAMANSLQVPSKSYRIAVIEVPFDGQRAFQIPVEAARHPAELAEVLNEMGRFAARATTQGHNVKFSDFGDYAVERLPSSGDLQDVENARLAWNTNVRWLSEQIAKGRDSIWVYVLQNTSRPLLLRHRKFDVIAGNPPWIAYRYIEDQGYQRDIKTLTREYGLLAANETKLNATMELASLFFEHSYRTYLKPGGTLGFVMPRSVITGAKQHRAFQQSGFSRVLDLKRVTPLFNTETCVLIREGQSARADAIPTTQFAGELPFHECSLAVAEPFLTRTQAVTTFTDLSEVASPYYFDQFKQGATLIPRTLVFVTTAQPALTPGDLAHTTIMRTDPNAVVEAKAPWKSLRHQGHVDDDFLYTTLLSRDLLPFGMRKLSLVALPVRVTTPAQVSRLPGDTAPERFVPMSLEGMRDSVRLARSAEGWFGPVARLWQEHRKSAEMDLWQRLDFQRGITGQNPVPGHLVLYNKSGSNISGAVLNTSTLPNVNGTSPRAFVADANMYWYRAKTEDEAHFLGALLNAPCVDAAIKARQPRGIYVGPRHITRLPFEVCPIPQFDPNNGDHAELAILSRDAHATVSLLAPSEGGVVAARKRARQAVHEYLKQIDAIAQRMLGLAPATVAVEEEEGEEEEGDAMLDLATERGNAP